MGDTVAKEPTLGAGPTNTASLEALQTEEQRMVLDTVAQIRKCGLERMLALPQLVVCGDQSAGKSSVLEALTEIPFPRNDELCTRFATEIIMRHAAIDTLTIRVIPDEERPSAEKDSIQAFSETITDFEELPDIMNKAMEAMGINSSGSMTRAFAKDVLSIEIEGPSRPQLTLVDLPGLIQNETKGVTKADIDLVREITDHYISQSRTICLAVVSATNDYANQGILTKVREVDPEGERTLGIITKPDRLPAGSGSEVAYINLARNEDVFFKLGWHVLKNRSFEEGDSSFEARNASEAAYFRTSNFNCLEKDCVGIDALRERLSKLLFAHVKQELPKLYSDLNTALSNTMHQISTLGKDRSSIVDCKEFLMQLSLTFHGVCKAAIEGHYEGPSFDYSSDETFSPTSGSAIRRLRAMVQDLNSKFSDDLRSKGHSYDIARHGKIDESRLDPALSLPAGSLNGPTRLSRTEGLRWVNKVMVRNRGRELQGNFNPLIIGELLWQQSTKWNGLASEHMETVSDVCRQFLHDLLREMCPKDVHNRLWSSHIEEALRMRNEAAAKELGYITDDLQGHPINYNHYYTDTIAKSRADREGESFEAAVQHATEHTINPDCRSNHTSAAIDLEKAKKHFGRSIHPDMNVQSCEEALDGLHAIYKVCQKSFIANVCIQVIERHIIKGLDTIFSPLFVNRLSDDEIEALTSEPASSRRQRDFLQDRISKLTEGHKILRRVMKSTSI